jgi:hypothetical protein
VVPFLVGTSWSNPTPTKRQASGGGPPPHFNKTWDNLANSRRPLSIEVAGPRSGKDLDVTLRV